MPKKGSKLAGLTEQLKQLKADLKLAKEKKDTNNLPLLQVQIKNTKVDLQAEQARLDKKKVEEQTIVILGKAVMSAYGVKKPDEALALLQARKPFRK